MEFKPHQIVWGVSEVEKQNTSTRFLHKLLGASKTSQSEKMSTVKTKGWLAVDSQSVMDEGIRW